jgi:zinc protease
MKKMKKNFSIYLILTVALFTSLPGFSQSNTKEINVEGLKIILKKTPKEVVTASLFIRGGVANITDAQQGIEPMALSLVLRGGTQSMDKNSFAEESDKLGTNFSSSASKDYCSMTMNCLTENWDKSWSMFTDAILHPGMNPNEFEVIKQQMLAGSKQQDANPDSYLRKLATQQIFEGTPYARVPNGIPETLEKLTIDDVKNYYSKLPGKKNCFLVVVGNVDEKDLIEKVRSSLTKLPEGKLSPKPIIAGVSKADVNIKDRAIATNYILGSLNGPKYFTADGPLFEFAMSILYDRYFVELRTKRSLSYAPAAFYNKSLIYSPTTQLYISTIDPKQSLQVMTDIINDVKKNGFTPKEVSDKKKGYLTNYYMTNEASSFQANTLGFCEASGNWRIFDEINNQVGKVQTEDLNRVFSKYMNAIAWTYLGKKDQVQESDFKQLAASGGKLPSSKVTHLKKD